MGGCGIPVRESDVNLRRKVPFPCVELETISRLQSICMVNVKVSTCSLNSADHFIVDRRQCTRLVERVSVMWS